MSGRPAHARGLSDRCRILCEDSKNCDIECTPVCQIVPQILAPEGLNFHQADTTDFPFFLDPNSRIPPACPADLSASRSGHVRKMWVTARREAGWGRTEGCGVSFPVCLPSIRWSADRKLAHSERRNRSCAKRQQKTIYATCRQNSSQKDNDFIAC